MSSRRRQARPGGARALFAALAAACLAGGCAVGPDYQQPAAPTQQTYTWRPVELPAAASQPEQRLQTVPRPPAAWWREFGSAELDRTVHLALTDSPSLQQARASLQQAREAVLVARGGLAPRLDLQAAAQRARAAGSASAAELYSAGPLVGYSPDVFGATRRLVEQQQALADVQAEQLRAARLSLSGQVVGQAIAAAAAREQLAALRQVLDADSENLRLVELALRAGSASRADLLSAQSQLDADRALAPALRQQLAAADDALARLVGRSAASWRSPDWRLDGLRLPSRLPLVVPSQLVRQRPDIRAAEAQLHAAGAAVGVATAALYPQLSLSADWTAQASSLGGLFGAAPGWGLSAALTAPLWHGGALRAQRRGALQAYEAQLALYRQTVLLAFNQVADVLQALRHDAELLAAQQRALRSADASLQLARQAYAAGSGNVLQVLAAQRLLAQARLGQAKARAQRLADSAQWFTAMGAGGTAPASP